MTQRYASSMESSGIRLRLLTPERAPLGIFSSKRSNAVAELMKVRGDRGPGRLRTSSRSRQGFASMPGGDQLEPGPAVALPQLVGTPVQACRLTTGALSGLTFTLGFGGSRTCTPPRRRQLPIRQSGTATQQADAGRSTSLSAFDLRSAEPFDRPSRSAHHRSRHVPDDERAGSKSWREKRFARLSLVAPGQGYRPVSGAVARPQSPYLGWNLLRPLLTSWPCLTTGIPKPSPRSVALSPRVG